MEKIVLLCLIMGAILLFAEWPRVWPPRRPGAKPTIDLPGA